MPFDIPRCYDSHLHLLATGIYDRGLGLHNLADPGSLGSASFTVAHDRGDWITSFGWDHHRFPGKKLPHRSQLDRVSLTRPILLSRGDGHACWVNRRALEIAGLWRERAAWPADLRALAEFDEDGWPSGILYEKLMYTVHALIPSLTETQKKNYFRRAMGLLNEAGYTHARDMECNSGHFQVLRALEDAGEVSVYLEENFNLDTIDQLDGTLRACLEARREPSRRLRVKGVKLYLDGALGSQGAWVSEPYVGTETRGFCTWKAEEVRELLARTWRAGLDVSVHALGDEAGHFMVTQARAVVAAGIRGRLNLEHTELLRDETIALMKGLDLTCHLQPCHWLTDRAWLVEKQPRLWKIAFPWARLEAAGIPFHFGSDTPIERPSLGDNFAAIEDLHRQGIARPARPWWSYHSHPDTSWGAECVTRVDDQGVVITSL